MLTLSLTALLGLGCADQATTSADSAAVSDTDADTDSDTDTDTDSDADADADADSDSDADTDADTDTDTAPETEIVRFVAMGDGGEGNDDQYANAAAIKALCASKDDDHPGCDFVLYLGDNFYNDGVEEITDDQFQDKFELPYAELDLPFMVVLGNHDYGETSLSWWKADPQVEYSLYSDKWNMPDKYYDFVGGPAQFYGLDTNSIMLDWDAEGQKSWLQGQMAASASTWQVVFGHHPYISNGQHGNAGNYEDLWWLPIVNGDSVKAFMEDAVCGQADLYVCGHDHNRQWLSPTCGTEFIVVGAAAKTTDLVGRDSQPTEFQDDTIEGFVWIEIADNVLTGEFYTMNGGSPDFTRTLTK